MIRHQYLKKMEEKLEEWSGDIDRLKDRAEKVEADLKGKYREELDVLRVKREAAVKSLRQVREASATTWGRMKTSADHTFDDLKKALEDAITRLRKSA